VSIGELSTAGSAVFSLVQVKKAQRHLFRSATPPDRLPTPALPRPPLPNHSPRPLTSMSKGL